MIVNIVINTESILTGVNTIHITVDGCTHYSSTEVLNVEGQEPQDVLELLLQTYKGFVDGIATSSIDENIKNNEENPPMDPSRN